MTAFLANVISNSRPATSFTRSLVAGISALLAERRKRAKLKADIRHLQQLPAHLIDDAGIDEEPLFSAVARIAPMNEPLQPGEGPRRSLGISKRPHSW